MCSEMPDEVTHLMVWTVYEVTHLGALLHAPFGDPRKGPRSNVLFRAHVATEVMLIKRMRKAVETPTRQREVASGDNLRQLGRGCCKVEDQKY